ncbi:hypothetical protein POJ06DRAFT_196306 [Lipomyces tetrasporus]|uniref:Uncharacterized protein n=1 Tax=Lipomyces tetrasporus TaxID=54092 RepID=A0AAD7QS53_9ASCO|nr:uncharacterized protein POJ06DRAFT_196306 [Lipomyces tetrasporus]KAJ8100468.1 hypothetical protein POJ06DRAFT_196306 [Lipomyces tetrasporus]
MSVCPLFLSSTRGMAAIRRYAANGRIRSNVMSISSSIPSIRPSLGSSKYDKSAARDFSVVSSMHRTPDTLLLTKWPPQLSRRTRLFPKSLRSQYPIPVQGTARYILTGRDPRKITPFTPLWELLELVPTPIKVFVGLFFSAGIVVFIAFPTIIFYLPVAILFWITYRRRQLVLREKQFQKLWHEMTSASAVETTTAQVRKFDVAQLVHLVENRVKMAIKEDGDFAYEQLGLDPARSRDKLFLSTCEEADREVRINAGYSEVTTILKFGLMRDGGHNHPERVADVTAAVTSYLQYQASKRADLEKTAMKITINSPGNEWTIHGVTIDSELSSDNVIDVKPRNVKDE